MTQDGHRLLITCSTFPRFAGDHLPRFIYDLGKSLTGHFAEVNVLAPGSAEAAVEENLAGMSIHRYTYMRPKKWQVLAYGSGMVQNIKKYPFAWLLIPLFIGFQVRAIHKICRERQITILNSHWMIFQGLAGAIARKRTPYHHVMHIHAGGLFAVYRLPRFIGKSLARYIVKNSNHIICESNFIKQSLDELLGFDSRASISCMGVDTALFKPSPDVVEKPESILFVGRLVEKKGVVFLLEAMAQVFASFPNAVLSIVGAGPLEEELRAKANSMDFPAQQVNFLGKRTHEELIRLFSEARVVTVPSIVDSLGETEGMPTVILEALAMGKRVVASDVAGASDVITHKKNGWLAWPEDADDLAEKLMQAMRDSDPEIVHQALETGNYYSWPNLGSRYAEMLQIPSR